MRRIILFCLLLSSLLVVVQDSVFAQSPQVETKVDHVANVFEKLQEKVTLFFKFSVEGKYEYRKYLLEKRLAELTYVISSDNWDPIEESSSRYATYIGNFTQFVIENKLTGREDEVLKMYERHSGVLEELKKNFEFESGWWLLLQHDINSTKIFSGQIQEAL